MFAMDEKNKNEKDQNWYTKTRNRLDIADGKWNVTLFPELYTNIQR